MNKLIFIIFFLGNAVTMIAQNNDLNQIISSDSIYNDKFDSNWDHVPVFLGNTKSELAEYVKNSLVYPAEAWMNADYVSYCAVRVHLLILKNGHVSLVKVATPVHPALAKEIERIFLSMPAWEPAKIKGKPVNVIYTCIINTYDEQMDCPYQLTSLLKTSKNYDSAMKYYKYGISESHLIEGCSVYEKLHQMAPANAYTMGLFARLTSAKGDYSSAAKILDLGIKKYHAIEWEKMDSLKGDITTCYDGKSDIDCMILRAITMENSGHLAKPYYDDAIKLIDEKIKVGNVAYNLNDLTSSKKYSIDDVLNLAGVKAMVIYLSSGITAMDEYISKIQKNPYTSLEIKKSFDKILKRLKDNSSLLNNRNELLNSYVCFAPLNKLGYHNDALKKNADKFYSYRKALVSVFPFYWLVSPSKVTIIPKKKKFYTGQWYNWRQLQGFLYRTYILR